MLAQKVHQDIRRIHEGVATLKAMCADVPDEMLEWQPSAAEWSIKQIMFHLGDAFEAMLIRIPPMLTEPTPHLLRFNADQWAVERRYQQRSWQEALAHLDQQMERLTDLVLNLDETQLAATGRQHNIAVNYLKLPTEVLAVHDLIRFEAGHVDEHIEQVDQRLMYYPAYAES